jgi:hypothetical protein
VGTVIASATVLVTVSVTAGGGDGSELPSTFTIANRERPWYWSNGSEVIDPRSVDNARTRSDELCIFSCRALLYLCN